MLNQSLKIKKSNVPYDYFIIDNLFDDSNYKAIRKDFYQAIENINSWHEEYGVAYSDNSKLDKPIYISGSTAHKDSYSYLLSKFNKNSVASEFLERLFDVNFFKKIVDKNLLPKNIKIHKPSKKIGLFHKLFYDNLTLSLKISRSSPGSGIAIHPDNYPKRISMLLYFGWSDNKTRKLGGTQIYDATNNFEPGHHYYFKHKNFKLHENVFPFENRLMGFVATKNSWHGVDPEETKDLKENNLTRDVLQINLVKHTNYGGILKIVTELKNFIRKLSVK